VFLDWYGWSAESFNIELHSPKDDEDEATNAGTLRNPTLKCFLLITGDRSTNKQVGVNLESFGARTPATDRKYYYLTLGKVLTVPPCDRQTLSNTKHNINILIIDEM